MSTNEYPPDDVLRRTITRRDLLRRASIMAGGAALLSATGGLLSACGSSGGGGGSSSKKVVVADWGGAIQAAEKKYLYDPFSKETGIEVVMSGPPSDARIKAMVDSGNVEWDLVAGAIGDVLNLGRDYFEPFPDSIFKVPGMPKEYLDSHAVAYYVFSTNIGWNTDMMGSKKLESWADFWNTSQFPGKRTLAGTDGGNQPSLEFALMADGVAMDQLYPIDMDRAFNSLAKIKGSVPQWWSSGSQPGQMMVSKQVSAASIWIGRIKDLQDQGAPIGYTFNQGEIIPASWIVPKGAPNKENAFKLAEFSIQPEIQAKLWGSYVEGPTNSKAFDSMPDSWAKQLPTFPDNAKVQFVRDDAWWGKNLDEVLRRFQEFVV